MTAAKEERRLLGYRVKDSTTGMYLKTHGDTGAVWSIDAQPPLFRDTALCLIAAKLGEVPSCYDSIRLVRVYAKPKPAERKSLGDIALAAYEATCLDGEPWAHDDWSGVALAVVEEVRRRLGEKFSLVGSNCLDIAWDQVIAEAKEGK